MRAELGRLERGRLPAADVAGASALALEIVAWEDAARSIDGRAVLVADNLDAAGDFEAAADAAQARRGQDVVRLREPGSATRGAIRQAFDAGAGFVSYLGHGGTAVWASENVWNTLDAGSLSMRLRGPGASR